MANVPSPALLSTIEQHEHRVLSVGKSGAPLKLSFAACRELDLAERVLTSAWLYAGCLDEANLRQCSLIRAYLVEASFVQALLDGALPGKADLRKASFRGASMKECNIVRLAGGGPDKGLPGQSQPRKRHFAECRPAQISHLPGQAQNTLRERSYAPRDILRLFLHYHQSI